MVLQVTLFNAGLLVVDHLHFQYNGFLIGILLLALYLAFERRYLLLLNVVSMLVLLKHLFVPLVPIFAIFLLRAYCGFGSAFSMPRFLRVILITAAHLCVAFGPFLIGAGGGTPQLYQILSRLFPFGRGLLHSYWAPNLWALYALCDRVIGRITSVDVSRLSAAVSNPTGGVIGEFVPLALPAVGSVGALSMVILSMIPAWCRIYSEPTPRVLLRAIVYASLSVFMFGYHVHEKASIIPTIVLGLVCFESEVSAQLFLHLATVSSFCQLPLIDSGHEHMLWVKAVIFTAYMALLYNFFHSKVSQACLYSWFFVLFVFLALFIFSDVISPAILTADFHGDGFVTLLLRKLQFFPFLPLLLTSTVCAVVMMACWVYSIVFLFQRVGDEDKKKM